MSKEARKSFNVTLDEYEREIEDNLGKARCLSSEEEKKESEMAQQLATNYKHSRKDKISW